MPRMIEERWVGITFDVQVERSQVGDERGRPVHDAHGLPKVVEHTTLVLIVPLPDGQRVVRVPFTDDAKRTLVQKLTGGIVVANGHDGLAV